MSEQQGTARTPASGNVWTPAGDARSDVYRSAEDAPTLPQAPTSGDDPTRVQPVAHEAQAPAQPARPQVVSAGPRSLARRTRKARLRLSRIDPWSVMKTSFLFSIAFGVMLVVAVFALWSVLASTGAIESANSFINQLIGDGDQQFNLEDYLSISRIMGLTVVIAAIDVVILTALATLLSFLYNLAATVLGGIEVTLAED